jgi:hypothetical protein
MNIVISYLLLLATLVFCAVTNVHLLITSSSDLMIIL